MGSTATDLATCCTVFVSSVERVNAHSVCNSGRYCWAKVTSLGSVMLSGFECWMIVIAWKSIVHGQFVLLAIRSTMRGGGSTAVLRMWCVSVVVVWIDLSWSGVLSWKDRNAGNVGVMILSVVWLNKFSLSSSMGVALVVKPWRAMSLVGCPRIGSPSWWWWKCGVIPCVKGSRVRRTVEGEDWML